MSQRSRGMQIIEKCFTGLSICLFMTAISYAQTKYEKAVFAGGCFWCMTPPFEKLGGVINVVSGYTGGEAENPNYEDYAGKGHLEAIEVIYDPTKIIYPELLDVFWRQIDPTDSGGQFCDRGLQYRAAIFYQNQEQKLLAERSKEALGKSGRFDKPLVTGLLNASSFYKAEDYHQDYHKKNPLRYKLYRSGCGRDKYLEKIWGGAGDKKKDLKKRLTPLQYKVTQEGGTEPAYQNEYWDNHREGIYVDIVSGEPLFISTDKFESGTGWPSFTKPLEPRFCNSKICPSGRHAATCCGWPRRWRGQRRPSAKFALHLFVYPFSSVRCLQCKFWVEPDNIVEKQDNSFFMKRTEVRSKHGDSHLGHVFNDGPALAGGLRYCMNSAALRFIPKEDLEKEGYGKYKIIFEKKK